MGEKIEDAHQSLHFTQEYKLIYCPWKTLYDAEVEIALVPGGTGIIHLPNLSRHKIFSRAECHEPLKSIFAD